MSVSNAENPDRMKELVSPSAAPWKYEIKYYIVKWLVYLHIAALYGLYLCFTSAKWQTIVFAFVVAWLSLIGVTAGAHRLWTHRTYKGTLLLRVFLMLCFSISFQKTLMAWVKIHRLHHKYTDTDADPHNSTRGLFYSHIGWIMVKRHPDVVAREKTIDLSDIFADPVIMFQSRNFRWLLPMCAMVIPTLMPILLWKESFNNAYHISILRFIVTLHQTFLVNSVAHKWGYKPFDISISSTQSVPMFCITYGEGFHNFHHTFPSDYRLGELNTNYFNWIKYFIDLWAFFGQAYDLNITSQEVVEAKAKRSGDGTNACGCQIKDR